MAVKRALGRSGGARGVDHQGRVIGSGRLRRKTVARLCHAVMQAMRTVTGSINGEDVLEIRQAIADLGDFAQGCLRCNQHPRTGIGQPEVQGIGAEQFRHGNQNGAKLVGGDMGDRDFRALRQHERDTVTTLDAMGAQQIGQPVGG